MFFIPKPASTFEKHAVVPVVQPKPDISYRLNRLPKRFSKLCYRNKTTKVNCWTKVY